MCRKKFSGEITLMRCSGVGEIEGELPQKMCDGEDELLQVPREGSVYATKRRYRNDQNRCAGWVRRF